MNTINETAFSEQVNCPVCHSAPYKVFLDEGKGTRYVRCSSCKTIFASPRSSRKSRYAALNATYSVGEKAFSNADSRKSALAEEAAIVQRISSHGKLLDVGCDLGDFFEGFPTSSWQRYGVEISRSAAEYASRKYSAHVSAGTIHDAAYPSGEFDLVTMLDIIYYLDDPCAELKEVARILKPGGILAIEIAGQNYLILRSHGLFCWLIDHRWTRISPDSSYIYFFTAEGLKRLLSQTGFTLVSMHVIGSPTTSNSFRRLATRIHRSLITTLYKYSSKWIDWAPKILLISRYGTTEELNNRSL